MLSDFYPYHSTEVVLWEITRKLLIIKSRVSFEIFQDSKEIAYSYRDLSWIPKLNLKTFSIFFMALNHFHVFAYTFIFFLPPLEYKFFVGRALTLFIIIYSGPKLCLPHGKHSLTNCPLTGTDWFSSYVAYLEHLTLMNIFFLMLPSWLLT